ncbi:unnamed protein product [Symbiodinium pilosum]|uniref:Uncharacterized protein n=1 Tax=Symbiodinium pilosum TaxID=2952 RepID=A0A812IXI0_SYMPI|nr:unnamed protein product [Symbiodinium pilosum]
MIGVDYYNGASGKSVRLDAVLPDSEYFLAELLGLASQLLVDEKGRPLSQELAQEQHEARTYLDTFAGLLLELQQNTSEVPDAGPERLPLEDDFKLAVEKDMEASKVSPNTPPMLLVAQVCSCQVWRRWAQHQIAGPLRGSGKAWDALSRAEDGVGVLENLSCDLSLNLRSGDGWEARASGPASYQMFWVFFSVLEVFITNTERKMPSTSPLSAAVVPQITAAIMKSGRGHVLRVRLGMQAPLGLSFQKAPLTKVE